MTKYLLHCQCNVCVHSQVGLIGGTELGGAFPLYVG